MRFRSVAAIRKEERGDVPGGVLITLMTAGFKTLRVIGVWIAFLITLMTAGLSTIRPIAG